MAVVEEAVAVPVRRLPANWSRLVTLKCWMSSWWQVPYVSTRPKKARLRAVLHKPSPRGGTKWVSVGKCWRRAWRFVSRWTISRTIRRLAKPLQVSSSTLARLAVRLHRTRFSPWWLEISGVFEVQFEEDGELITETITIVVESATKLVAGVRCVTVRDTVVIDGQLIEDTDDCFAQDLAGNVWYCGEEVKDFETFDEDSPAIPELVAIDGSFKAGLNGDEAGILLPGTPRVGDVFRQEISFANAEDVIEIIAIDGDESVPAADCAGSCVVTRDFTPLDPGVEENKYYLPGVGKILEVDLENGARFELISTNVTP